MTELKMTFHENGMVVSLEGDLVTCKSIAFNIPVETCLDLGIDIYRLERFAQVGTSFYFQHGEKEEEKTDLSAPDLTIADINRLIEEEKA